MTEVFDMNMNDLFGEESEFIEVLQNKLEGLGLDIDASSLAVVLHEYELAKMEFLKNHIMNMLKERGDLTDGPVKLVVSQGGMDLKALSDDEFDFPTEEDSEVDSNLIS